MMKKCNYSVHLILLCAVYTVGNSIITAPYKAVKENCIIAFITAALISAVLVFLISVLIDLIPDIKKTKSNLKKILYIASALIISVFLLYIASISFIEFTGYISSAVLPKTSHILISIIFAFTVIFTAIQKNHTLLKFSVLSFVMILITSLLFFVLSIPDYHIKISNTINDFSSTLFIKQTAIYLYRIFLPTIVLIIYSRMFLGKKRALQCSFGVLIGSGIIFICLLNSILLFGVKQAAELQYAYSDAISTVTVGYLFTRMDGFAYITFFASCLVRCSLCISLVFAILKKASYGGIKNSAV